MACEIKFPSTHIMDVNEIDDKVIDLYKNYLINSGLFQYINQQLVRGFANASIVTDTIDFASFDSNELDYFDFDVNKMCDFIVDMCNDSGVNASYKHKVEYKVEFTFTR